MNVYFNSLKDKKPNEIKLFIKENLKECFLDIENINIKLLEDNRKTVKALESFLNKEKIKYDEEVLRVKELYRFDRKHGRFVCGVDEVGRGPLAGPIVSCAVVLKSPECIEDMILEINDSKKLTKIKREKLAEEIEKRCIAYSIAENSNKDIDRDGIAFCNNDIFLKAVSGLNMKVETVLSDGYPIKNFNGRNVAVVKGDTKSAAIACASIVAKVYRDKIMEEYSSVYPEYGFDHNVGYGSNDHIEALKKYGPTNIHRMSFLRNILND